MPGNTDNETERFRFHLLGADKKAHRKVPASVVCDQCDVSLLLRGGPDEQNDVYFALKEARKRARRAASEEP